jgi:hypothetical protein
MTNGSSAKKRKKSYARGSSDEYVQDETTGWDTRDKYYDTLYIQLFFYIFEFSCVLGDGLPRSIDYFCRA